MKKLEPRYLFHRCLLLAGALAGLCLVLAVFCAAGWGLWACVLALPALAGLLYAARRWIWIPYREDEKLLELFADGYTRKGIDELDCPFSPALDSALKKYRAALDTGELISAAKKQAQYLALQNQINPHFLYNTLEGIRGEAITAGLYTVAEMTEALATFFRYTISNVEQLVTLEDELENIQNYYLIQQYRFGERINLEVVCDEDDRSGLMQCRLPKLTLQPIVENAIIHGIERKIGRGNLRIKLEYTPNRLIITVSDDGLGIEEARLRELNRRLETSSFDYVKPDGEKKGGIAVVNVNDRIRLLFGEEYGVTIYSSVGLGTDVEITLPRIAGKREAAAYEK